MNSLTSSIPLSALLFLSLSACQPEETASERLGFILEQNEQLKQSISTMQSSIDRAGEYDETLYARVEQMKKQVTEEILALTDLDKQEHQTQIRIIELQSRLSKFQSDFTLLQKQLSTVTSY